MESYQVLKVKLTGVAPLIMSNPQAADPLNPYHKALKEYTGKRVKTENDHLRIAQLQFESSLYLDEDKKPIVPTIWLYYNLINGAKKTKITTNDARAGIFIEKSPILNYEGEKDYNKMFENGIRFTELTRTGFKGITSKTQAIFKDWWIAFYIHYLIDLLDKDNIESFLFHGGLRHGIGAHRPTYGRYNFEIID